MNRFASGVAERTVGGGFRDEKSFLDGCPFAGADVAPAGGEGLRWTWRPNQRFPLSPEVPGGGLGEWELFLCWYFSSALALCTWNTAQIEQLYENLDESVPKPSKE